MKNCRIAILDSGIDKTFIESKDILYKEDAIDENGHGTMCYSVIKNIAPNTAFYIHKVLDKELMSSSEKLICNLREVARQDIDLVHLSLSTSDYTYKKDMEDICRKIYSDGKILIASHDNDTKKTSFPCEFDTVVGVGGAIFDTNIEFRYRKDNSIQAIANKVPSLVKGKNGLYNFFGGTSKAAACMTGIIAGQWERIKSLNHTDRDEFLNSMANQRLKEKWKDTNSEVFRYVQEEFIPYRSNINEKIVCQFLNSFEKEFNVILEYERISLLDFSSAEQLSLKLSQLAKEA